MLLGRREDVDDATAYGELTATLDQVDPVVGRGGEPAHDILQVGDLAFTQRHRLEVAETLHLRLQDRPHRRDDDPDRALTGRLVLRVEQPAKDREPSADGV